MSLCFLGATDEHLAEPDTGVGVSQISIQPQRMFTFGDALRGAPGQYIDNAQRHMAKRVIRNRRQSFGQLCLGRGEGRHRIRREGIEPSAEFGARRFDKRVHIVWIG